MKSFRTISASHAKNNLSPSQSASQELDRLVHEERRLHEALTAVISRQKDLQQYYSHSGDEDDDRRQKLPQGNNAKHTTRSLLPPPSSHLTIAHRRLVPSAHRALAPKDRGQSKTGAVRRVPSPQNGGDASRQYRRTRSHDTHGTNTQPHTLPRSMSSSKTGGLPPLLSPRL